jgi:hypothetical protein
MIGHVRLIDFGVSKPVNESIDESMGSPTGYFLEADRLIFIQEVDKIKITKGLVFGISYQIESSQAAFLSRVIHPTLVNFATGKPYKETIEKKYMSSDGLHFDYYRLEHTWEMVAGRWTFQIEQSGRVLLENRSTYTTNDWTRLT